MSTVNADGPNAALSTNGAKVYAVGRREEELKKIAEMYKPSGSGSIIPLPGSANNDQGYDHC